MANTKTDKKSDKVRDAIYDGINELEEKAKALNEEITSFTIEKIKKIYPKASQVELFTMFAEYNSFSQYLVKSRWLGGRK